ncbi:MAG: hypothetical protein ACLQO7_01875 [Candidatus Bathyarchaeia archaeon]
MMKLLQNRKGTAEVIGTIMFIVIMLFFFTNVYLWHDAATKDANQLYVEKVNAGMSISFDAVNSQVFVNATSSEVTLSRLWIDTPVDHLYVNLTSINIQVAPGDTNGITIKFGDSNSEQLDQYGINYVTFTYDQLDRVITVNYYPLPSAPIFTIVNSMGVAVST